ncbi:sporulation protein [Dokdonia pacifica]|uniref:Sporulation related domain-containing protein n=1 Tax=Dokdonia pacifica TaxID=1627892 RepID=A0A238VTX0_9FLAO|nr:SPOR domain-containing protein [Dokdonia pacifica]GGG18336.1 sporulation protein [Dokdonia pacifica]SNR36939.1 Sporulation related domain-containing protein [Dokdonia pacifica]
MRIHPNIKALTLFVFLSFYAFAKAQTAQVNVSQDAKIPQLLELKNELSNDNELGDHYKIQIYSGNSAQAGTMLKRFRNKVGTWKSDIEYETPNYKVWVGSFRNRLEADRALIEIKKEFPNALIFKPDVKR